MIRVQLREMKEKCGYSNKKIAELSGVSLPTVNRIMSGQTDVPNFQTVCDLIIAMGGSLDELAGIQPKPAAQDEGSVEIYKEIIKEKDIWLKRLFVITCLLAVVLIGITDPSTSNLIELAKLFKVSPEELLKGER